MALIQRPEAGTAPASRMIRAGSPACPDGKKRGFMPDVRRLALLSLLLCAAVLTGSAQGNSAQNPGRAVLGVFSWQRTNASDEKAARALFETLAEVGAGEVYQVLGGKTAPSFWERAGELRIAVYALAGRPEWGLDTNARQMIRQVDSTAKLMAQMGGDGPVGLMLDVEPYLTKAFRKDPERTMEKYLTAMKKAYARAREKGVFLILCIPHFYDAIGHAGVLDALIREACDAVAVMNYQKEDETGQIKTEMEASRQAGKRLIHIYELQRPGLHDLTESNTYYTDGLPAVWESSEKLRAFFDYAGLSFALHDITALREVIAR